MSDSLDFRVFQELLVSLACEITVIVGLATLIVRHLPSACDRRRMWQIGIASIAAVLLGELSGTTTGLCHWAAAHWQSSSFETSNAVEPASERDALFADPWQAGLANPGNGLIVSVAAEVNLVDDEIIAGLERPAKSIIAASRSSATA